MQLEYFELIITTYLKKDIYFNCSGALIGDMLNKTMLKNSYLKNLHKQNVYKHYCFGSFFPIEKDKTYKKGSVYTFKIRSLNSEFTDNVWKNIKKIKDDNFSVLAIEYTKKNIRQISNIYTVTPTVITLEKNRNWTQDDDVLVVMDRIKSNLEKKYKSFYGENVVFDSDIIDRFELMNKKPVTTCYKNTKFLGNKFKIWFNQDENAQKLAFIAITCGLGEKNSSVGAGFCMGG